MKSTPMSGMTIRPIGSPGAGTGRSTGRVAGAVVVGSPEVPGGPVVVVASGDPVAVPAPAARSCSNCVERRSCSRSVRMPVPQSW
jgi:hypothetical protein